MSQNTWGFICGVQTVIIIGLVRIIIAADRLIKGKGR